MRCNDVASTSYRRHVLTGILINQCEIITFLILKSGNIENSRIELKEIVLPEPSNHIKVTFYIILPFNLVHLRFVLFHIEIEGKCGGLLGGGGKGYVGLPLKLLGGGTGPLAHLFLRLLCYMRSILCSYSKQNFHCLHFWKIRHL